MKKQERDETMIDINAALYFLKVIREYTSENECVRSDMEIIK